MKMCGLQHDSKCILGLVLERRKCFGIYTEAAARDRAGDAFRIGPLNLQADGQHLQLSVSELATALSGRIGSAEDELARIAQNGPLQDGGPPGTSKTWARQRGEARETNFTLPAGQHRSHQDITRAAGSLQWESRSPPGLSLGSSTWPASPLWARQGSTRWACAAHDSAALPANRTQSAPSIPPPIPVEGHAYGHQLLYLEF